MQLALLRQPSLSLRGGMERRVRRRLSLSAVCLYGGRVTVIDRSIPSHGSARSIADGARRQRRPSIVVHGDPCLVPYVPRSMRTKNSFHFGDGLVPERYPIDRQTELTSYQLASRIHPIRS